MKEQRTALNLQPGDEIEYDGNWWIITDHKFSLDSPAPVEMQLTSRDREFRSAIITTATHPFNCEPYCC